MTENKKTEKEQELRRINEMIKGRVCSQCGSPLEAVTIMWEIPVVHSCCNNCKIIEYGTTPETYELARRFVVDHGFDYYNDRYGDEDYLRLINTRKAAEIFDWYEKAKEDQHE